MKLGCAFIVLLACKRHEPPTVSSEPPEPTAREDDGDEAQEEQDRDRANYWRVRVVIVGQGTVDSKLAPIACTTGTSGRCGPTLLTFAELRPPLLRATAAPGWRFDHWASVVQRRDGTTVPRTVPMPDGPLYIDGFGYEDTGELETLTAVFVGP